MLRFQKLKKDLEIDIINEHSILLGKIYVEDNKFYITLDYDITLYQLQEITDFHNKLLNIINIYDIQEIDSKNLDQCILKINEPIIDPLEHRKNEKNKVSEYCSPVQRYALESPSIGIDLDRTLMFFDKWKDITYMDPLLPKMVEKIKMVKKLGYKVKILTSRLSDVRTKPIIEKYLEENDIPFDEITVEKDSSMVEIWDDLAVAVNPNTGEFKYHNSSRVLKGIK